MLKETQELPTSGKGSHYRCSVCEKPGHDRRMCPDRPLKKRRCKVCQDMPHRRDVAPYREYDDSLDAVVPSDPFATECRGCGEPYVPEPPVTIFQVMDLPREDRRAAP